MVKLYIFDMGGVLIRDFHIAPRLLPYLGYPEAASFKDISPRVTEALKEHGKGLIDEPEFWSQYQKITGRQPYDGTESLLGKFFTPVLDAETVAVLQDLVDQGKRVVCGTNVIDAHYDIHQDLHQYDVFDTVYASHLIHLSKPDCRFFEYICEQEGVAPHETFFTDDLAENVDAARQAGLKAFVYTDAQSLKVQLASL